MGPEGTPSESVGPNLVGTVAVDRRDKSFYERREIAKPEGLGLANLNVPPMSSSCSNITGSNGNSVEDAASSVLQTTKPMVDDSWRQM